MSNKEKLIQEIQETHSYDRGTAALSLILQAELNRMCKVLFNKENNHE